MLRTWCFLEKACVWYVFFPRYHPRTKKVWSTGVEYQGTMTHILHYLQFYPLLLMLIHPDGVIAMLLVSSLPLAK